MHDTNRMIQAGCAVAVITPPAGAQMAGYFKPRTVRRVRDDLYARALALGTGGEALLVVSCDLIAMPAEIADAVKAAVLHKHGVPPAQVCICATHTHTGPEIRENTPVACDPAYNRSLVEALLAVTDRALSSRFDACLSYGAGEAAGLAFNRLYRLRDGSEIFGRLKPREHEIVGPAGPVDPSVQVVAVRDAAGKIRAIMVNFACHPDTYGLANGDFVSADWPGEMARVLRAAYGEDAVVIFLQGCRGDLNHVNYDGPPGEPKSGEHKTVQLGRGVAGAAMLAIERSLAIAGRPLAARLDSLEIPYYRRDASILREAAELRRREQISPKDQYFASRVESWPFDGQAAQVPIQAMRLGEVGLVALPAEIFTAVGMEIKRYAPSSKTMVVELANARVSSYVPTEAQAERGGYGAKPILTRHLSAEAARLMSDTAVKMLHEVWA